MSRIIVKNLPTDCSEETLRGLVSRAGTVTEVALKFTKDGVFRKFAFVGFLQEAEASNAIKFLDKSFLGSARLSVQVASSLGDKSKPRAWSKYAEDSSRNKTMTKKSSTKDAVEEEKKDKTTENSAAKENLNELDEDPEFAEFLKVHDVKNRTATWGNDVDDVGKTTKTKVKKGKDRDEEKNVDEETGETEISDKSKTKGKKKKKKKKSEKVREDETPILEKKVVDDERSTTAASDLDYLKSKKTMNDIFSDSESDGEVEEKEHEAEKVGDAKEDDGEEAEDEEDDDDDEEKDILEDSAVKNTVDEGDEEVSSRSTSDPEEKEKFTVKMRGLPFNIKEKQIREFFHPLEVISIKFARWKNASLGIAHASFTSKADAMTAMKRNKNKIGSRYIELFLQIRKPTLRPSGSASLDRDPAPWELKAAALKSDGDDALVETGRIFVRNLSYLCKAEDLETLFSPFGPVVDTHLPLDGNTKKPKGFAFVTFMMPEHAVNAFNTLDGNIFQGRMLHLLPAKAKKETEEGDDASFKKKKEAELKKRSGQAHTWNALFLGANAVADVVAEKYNTTKSAVLDAGGPGSLAVRMALGETQIVNETRDFLVNHGVCLDAFDAVAAAEGKKSRRSTVCLLAKNLPAGTTASEIGDLFSPFGTLARLVLPPSGVTAIVEFQEAVEAKTAFRRLAYSKFKHLPLYLEWAPVGVFKPDAPKGVTPEDVSGSHVKDEENDGAAETAELVVDSSLAENNATLYAKNVNFSTDDATLQTFFATFGPVVSAVIARHKDVKTGEVLSRGYGFVQFQRAKDARAALKGLQGAQLDGHALELKLSNRNVGTSTGGERTSSTSASSNVPSAKILVRNIPFEAKQKEIEELFRGFGELKSVRLPKKAVGKGKHRGFAFVEFLSKEDAKKAFDTFKHSTHLLGRRLVLEWAAEEEDVEAVRKRTADKFGDGREDVAVKRMKKATVDADEFLKKKRKKDYDDDDDDN